MASHLYGKWKEALITGAAASALNDGTYIPKAALIDTGSYTWSDAHQYYSDLAGIGGTPQDIPATRSYTAGNFKTSGLITYTAVAGTVSYEAVVIYIPNAGANTTWRLVAYLDAANVTGLPVTSNGGDITLQFNTTDGIFTL